jgi:hypothetical protein
VCCLWAKGCNAKDIRREMFPVYGGKCDFHLFGPLKNHLRGKPFADDEDAEVGETTVKKLLCLGFRRTGKAMGQVYQCWWRICLEINVLSRLNITCFTVYIHS